MYDRIIALALMAVFYGCYFAKMISQKKKGIKTNQLGKDKQGATKFIEIALKITTCLLPVIQICSIFILDRKEGNVQLVLGITGMIVTATGVIFFILSVLQMKDNWRAGVQREEKTNLVTNGIYSISRNPAFVGFEFMYIGILCTFFNVYLCVVTGLALVLFHLQIVKVEEAFLEEAFTEEYFQYKKKVFRYLGRKIEMF